MSLSNFDCPRTRIRTAVGLLAAASLALGVMSPAFGSSHREAPLITTMPKVDGTDFYMFRSYEPGREGYVTFIANYIPLQDPYGGPNYFAMDPDAVYMIHINNDGSGNPNLTFRIGFQNTGLDTKLTVGGKQVSIPLVINGGPINGRFPAGINVRETYNISLASAAGEQAVTMASNGAQFFDKPIDNVGMKSIPNYEAYAAQHVYDIKVPGCTGNGRVFVGQRKDPFVVNLGQTFDLINIKFPATEFDPNAETLGKDDLEDKNVTTIALELPIACVTTSASPIIGAWTTAAVRQTKTFNASPASGLYAGATSTGNFVQVSRLSAPLVNELVIGLKDKDKFNASRPVDDAANFAEYVTNPTLPALIEILFGAAGVKAPTNFPRNDLIAAFLTGVEGLNKPPGVVPAEMMRLNTSIAPKAKGAQNRLGVIGGDTSGFPNGRRPGDDVVDIELRVAMGILCTLNLGCTPAQAPSGGIHFTDGAYLDDSFINSAFPYLKSPIPGSP
ncbi:MAG: DUF4331 domain-containing protein [Betaproteobacteria bacterium]